MNRPDESKLQEQPSRKGILSVPETTPIIFNHFSFFQFTPNYFSQPAEARQRCLETLLSGLKRISEQVEIYQVYPFEVGQDILVWSAVEADREETEQFATTFARVTNPLREFIQPMRTLWGFTRPSQYTKTRSPQEIDPFSSERKKYLVLYPFVKTRDWYLLSREVRQGMMNEHIRVGKMYPEIRQLLLYSFGLQDQEFVVVYETDDLIQFSDLVYTLRETEVRRYTERDTPLATAIYHPPEATLALWE